MANEKTNMGVGIPMVVFIVFLILKLTGLISWSWWWVTAPIWIPASILILSFAGVLIYWAKKG